MGDTTVTINFPELLPGSAVAQMPGVRYLDPGVSAGLDEERRYAPEALPMAPAEAAGWLAQATGYAAAFNPGDLRDTGAASGARPQGRWAADPTSAIVTQLLAMEAGGAAPGGPVSGVDEGAFRAQSVLLLAWERERGLSEMDGLDAEYGGVLERFGRSLGLDDDDREELVHAAGELKVDAAAELYAAPDDWKPLLAACLRLLPEDVALFTSNTSVAEFWSEVAGTVEALEGDALAAALPGAPAGRYMAARCPGYRLLGRTRAPEDAPWLAAERRVVLRLPAEGA